MHVCCVSNASNVYVKRNGERSAKVFICLLETELFVLLCSFRNDRTCVFNGILFSCIFIVIPEKRKMRLFLRNSYVLHKHTCNEPSTTMNGNIASGHFIKIFCVSWATDHYKRHSDGHLFRPVAFCLRNTHTHTRENCDNGTSRFVYFRTPKYLFIDWYFGFRVMSFEFSAREMNTVIRLLLGFMRNKFRRIEFCIQSFSSFSALWQLPSWRMVRWNVI